MCQGIINSTEIYVTVKLTKMTLQTVPLLRLVIVFLYTLEDCILVARSTGELRFVGRV